jgi:transposase-like protein
MIKEEKMGGPYTKKEQETRRNQIFELHFQQGYSAVSIAKTLGVNRNTVNKDIEFLFSEIRNDKSPNHKNQLDKQVIKLDYQKTRLQKELDKDISIKERIQIEKMISDADLRIAAFFVKLVTTRRHNHLG